MFLYLTDPQELRVVKKECFNRWYGLTPYYLALTISRLPLQILFNFIFSTLVYTLSGLPMEPWRFLTFTMIGIIVSFVSEGLGLAIGATFNVTVISIIFILVFYVNFFNHTFYRMVVLLDQCAWHPFLDLPFMALTLLLMFLYLCMEL